LVQPASHEAFVSEQARQSKESTGRQMETATIRIPRRGDN